MRAPCTRPVDLFTRLPEDTSLLRKHFRQRTVNRTRRCCSASGRGNGDFVTDGTKWPITGAVAAAFAIILAKNNSDALGPAGATVFLSLMNAPGIHIERVLDSLDGFMAGGHAVVRLDGLRVVDRSMQILGGLGITDDPIVARLFREVRPRCASMTVPPRCIAGRSHGGYCGQVGRRREGGETDRLNRLPRPSQFMPDC